MVRADFLKDPYPFFAKLRRESPVSRLDDNGPWLIARHADALAVLKDAERFRSSRVPATPGPMTPDFLLTSRGIVGADPPVHTRLRSLVKDAFAPARMRVLEDGIRETVRAQLHALAMRGELELVSDFSKLLPMSVLALLMGVPPAIARDFGRWCDIMVTWGGPDCAFQEAEVRRNAVAMHDFFAGELACRSNAAGDDLISYLARNLGETEKNLAPSELLSLLRLLLVAGTETTTHLIGNTIIALLEQPGLWSRMQKDRSRVPDLIEESLRYDSPVPALIRWANVDTSIGGIAIRKDEAVMPLLGSGNRDEAVFPEPDRFLLDRPTRAHLSFGGGPHYCLGTVLARLQVRIVFEELLEVASGLERVGTATIERVESFFVRGPTRLSLRLVP